MPNGVPRSVCVWPRQVPAPASNHPIVRLTCLCHKIIEVSVFVSIEYINLFDLGVEVAFYYRSAVAYYRVDLLKFPRRNFSSNRADNTFVMLICCCFFHLQEPLVCIGLNSRIYSIYRASLIAINEACATPSGRLLSKRCVENYS